jgi:chromosome segregation ATPase
MTHDVQLPPDPAVPSDQPGAELRALGQAGEQALQLIQQAITSGDRAAVSPIEAVILLDDAMKELRGLQTVVPALLAAAAPGRLVTEDINARADELSALTEQVNAVRHELELLETREEATRTRLAELSALRDQVDELRRRERLVEALHELNEQGQVIEQRLTLLRQLTEHPEEAIAASAGEVVRLAEERRAQLAPHVRDLLAQAGEALQLLARVEERLSAAQERLSGAQERLSAAQQRLSAAQERQAQLAAECDERLAQLAAHARADSALAAALSPGNPDAVAQDPVGRLQAVLDGIVAQLDEVDGIMRNALIGGQDDYDREHASVGWTGQQTGSG